MTLIELFQYAFFVRAIEAGIIVALLAPIIGIFLVLKRYSLIADTLSHVSLAGVALGFLLKINPLLTALAVTMVSALGIERLRAGRHIYGESALSLFLSGGLALATVLLSMGRGFNTELFSYLFGSLVTVTQTDVFMMAGLAAIIILVIAAFYKELVYISFSEESARVSGIPVDRINAILILLSAVTVALAIPVVGVLLISALIVIPVVTAMQLRLSFARTLLAAEVYSVASVLAGIVISASFDLSTGGTIVLVMLAAFLATTLLRGRAHDTGQKRP
ncbi:metal ABC transporter permease [Candidatus Kaiserbacteria bacterium]|nr:metal ABC transporter permease [Candidatus Kaiserbacteria bacterium]